MQETRIPLPEFVEPPVEVFLNGVPLESGTDFELRSGELVVSKVLVKEGKLGFWRWFLGAWGIGTYRRNDVVDVRYRRDGATKVLHDVGFEGTAPDGQERDSQGR